ncbi:MAG: sugar phosphate isomerase/epimerase family protein [Planctomycetota bacterium]
MSSFTFGCQTITFGGDQKEDFPAVFDAISDAGYDGVEIGFRHIQDVEPRKLKEMLDDADLSLLGTHLGGNLEDKAQADEEKKILDEVLEYIEPLGTGLIMYSGLRYGDAAQFKEEVEMLSRSAEHCREHGVSLCYHNHNWEFEDDGRVIRALLDDASRALGFCPDIGWVMKGGGDVLQFLKEAGDRVHTLHFKDFATDGEEVDTVVLGTGVAPLREAAWWAKSNMDGGWMVTEQDSAELPAGEAVRRNADYLKKIFLD